MADPLADADDVAAIWRPLSSAEIEQATDLCSRASALLRSRVPTVDSRIALYASDPSDIAALDPVVVATVVGGMVRRVMVNASGAISTSVAADGVSRTTSFAGSRFTGVEAGLGELAVTDADLDRLTPPTDRPAIPSSIRMGAGLAPCLGGPVGLSPFAGSQPDPQWTGG